MSNRWRTRASSSAMALLLVLTLSVAGSIYGASAARCDSGDREALLEFKRGFLDPGGSFGTWAARVDCCSWTGVNCSSAGRVRGLTIQAPAPQRGLPPTRNPQYVQCMHDVFLAE